MVWSVVFWSSDGMISRCLTYSSGSDCCRCVPPLPKVQITAYNTHSHCSALDIRCRGKSRKHLKVFITIKDNKANILLGTLRVHFVPSRWNEEYPWKLRPICQTYILLFSNFLFDFNLWNLDLPVFSWYESLVCLKVFLSWLDWHPFLISGWFLRVGVPGHACPWDCFSCYPGGLPGWWPAVRYLDTP